MTSSAFRLAGIVALATSAWAVPGRAQSCAADTDCASPLACKSPGMTCSQSGMKLPDGGMYVSDPVCQPLPTECTWVLLACQANAECTLPNWGCFLVPGQTTVKTCFPKYITCSPTEPCPAEWLCIDSARVYKNNPLEVWGEDRGGPNYCWPSSLGGALAGSTRTDTSGLGLSSPDGGSGDHKGDGGAVALLDAPAVSTDAGTRPILDSAVASGSDVSTVLSGGDTQAAPVVDSGTALSANDASAPAADAGAPVTPTTSPESASSGCGCVLADRRPSDGFALLALFGLLCLGRGTRQK
jgi:hypothetical protein